jgi:putative YhdH/YhfP family quinone oxidoreductase
MTSFKAYRTFEEDKKVSSRFVTMTVDELNPGEVVIRSEYSTINFKDALSYNGAGRIMRRYPCNAGIDVAGEVTSSTDARFKPGDKVICNSYDFGVAHDGGFSEYCRVPAAWVVPMPAGMNTFDAMCLGVAGFTAGLAVERMQAGGLRPEQGPLVVNGATGGVGSVAIDIFARLGYRVVALTGKPQEAEYLKGLGAAEVLPRSSLPEKIRALDKATWAGGVDSLGGDTLAWMLSTCAVGAVVGSVGLAQSAALNTTVMPFILRGASLLGIDSVNCPMAVRRQVWHKLAHEWKPLHLAGAVRTIAFEQLPDAFGEFLSGAIKGRVVVKIGA